MNIRSKLLFLAIAIAPLVAISAACGNAFAPSDPTPDAGEAGATTDDAGDAGAIGPVGANEDVAPDDATTRDGTSRVDAAGCTCDCDIDGFQRQDSMCDGGPGPRADCDDLDELVNPNAGFVAAAWTSPHVPAGDWNCDGTLTKQYDYNQKCDDLNNCNGKAGFAGDPACGDSAPFNTCAYSPGIAGVGGSCKVGSTSTVTQGCK